MPRQELQLQVVRRLGPHAGAWDELAACQPLPSPFLRSWWLDHAAGGEPVLLCWFDDDDLVGGAALERDRLGSGRLSIERLRCLGQGVLAPDHLDLIATDDHRDRVARSLLRWLHRRGSRVIDLDGLAADGVLAAAFAGDVIERTAAPYAKLPADPDSYLSARPGQVRSTVRRTAKRFERAGVTHRCVAVADGERALDELARLHDGRWEDESTFLSAWERFRPAALAGLAAGEVSIDELVDPHGAVIATELDLVVGGRTCFYQAGRDTDREWRGGGSVLRAEIVGRSIRAGHLEYDLLRGDEPYKADWADGRRELVRCRAGIGPLGVAALGAHAARQRIDELRSRRGSDEVSPGPSRTGPGLLPEPNG